MKQNSDFVALLVDLAFPGLSDVFIAAMTLLQDTEKGL